MNSIALESAPNNPLREPYEDANPLLSVVIPLYREGVHLATTLPKIISVLDTIDVSYEVLLVDDGSPDTTWQVVSQQCATYSQVKGLRLSRNFGKEAALAAGLEQACGSAIVVMDGDLQHPPALIPQMLQHWREGVEVVEAVKQHRGQESAASRARAKLFYSFFTKMTGFDLHGASDFKLMDRRVLDAWRQMGERNLFFRGMSAWLGFRRVQIPFNVEERVGGESGWSIIQLAKLALNAVTTFSSAPLYLLIATGLGFALFALVLGVQTLYQKLIGNAVDGFTTIILLLLILGTAVMLGLGLIGIYIARIYGEVKGRPRFVIAERAE
jgi:glycosyltransferase involved in cell wall biosynthesis